MEREIGIIDSGLGGICVLAYLYEHFPNYHYVFIGDQKYAPYGDKEKETLVALGMRLLAYFRQRKINEVVIACNTMCSNALEELKKAYPEMKLYGIIEATCKQLHFSHKKVCVLATSATIASHAYKKQLEMYEQVKEIACPKLVPCIEQGKSKEEIQAVLKEYLAGESDVDALILGCTHYPLVTSLLKPYVPKAVIYDSNAAILKQLCLHHQSGKSVLEIYTTKDANYMKQQIQHILKKDYEVKSLDL